MSSRNVPQAADARVSVLMVLADSGADALEAARRALAAPQCSELIVLDNASRDGIAQRLAREHADDARVRVLQLGANLGFGAAMNRGAAASRTGHWLAPSSAIRRGGPTRRPGGARPHCAACCA